MIFVKYLVDHLLLLLVIHHSPMQWGCQRQLQISVCVNHMPKRMPLRPYSRNEVSKLLVFLLCPLLLSFPSGTARNVTLTGSATDPGNLTDVTYLLSQDSAKSCPFWQNQLTESDSWLTNRPRLLTGPFCWHSSQKFVEKSAKLDVVSLEQLSFYGVVHVLTGGGRPSLHNSSTGQQNKDDWIRI